MYAHYSNVWAAMDRDAFVIVLLNVFANDGSEKAAGVEGCIEKIRTRGYEYTYLDEVLRRGVKYKYVVSNHCMGGSSVNPMPNFRRNVFLKRAINWARSRMGRQEKYAI